MQHGDGDGAGGAALVAACVRVERFEEERTELDFIPRCFSTSIVVFRPVRGLAHSFSLTVNTAAGTRTNSALPLVVGMHHAMTVPSDGNFNRGSYAIPGQVALLFELNSILFPLNPSQSFRCDIKENSSFLAS